MQSFSELLGTKARSNVQYLLNKAKGFQNEIYIAICVLFVIYVIGVVIKRARRKFPPGPRGLPFFGYLPYLSENVFLDLTKLGEKYGDIFSLRMGSMNVVVLHGVEAIKEAFSKPEFLGRPPHSDIAVMCRGSPFFAAGVDVWREQRRFVVQSMKDLGLGKSKIEDNIQDEINHFLDVIKSHNGAPMDLKEPLSPSMSNNISSLVFGKRLEYEDPDRKLLDVNVDAATDGVGQKSAYTFYPWLRFIPFSTKFLHINQSITAFSHLRKYFRSEVEKHKQTLDPRNVRDYIDSYFVELENRKIKNQNTTLSEETLVASVIDIFGAGSETVRSSILWAIYIVADYPEVQRKVQQEIQDVVGAERSPNFMDQKLMPYTHAVILEVSRWKTLVPLNLLHSTVADTTVGGFDIPKDTYVLANFHNAHHNPLYWDDPSTFKPERFLNKDGTAVVKSSNLIPFSYGRRACPGEAMANMEVFLYFTSLLQRFNAVFPEGYTPDYNAKLSVVYRLEPYKIRLIKR